MRILLLVLGLLMVSPAQVARAQDAGTTSPVADEFTRLVETLYPQTLSILRADFPKEYDALIAKVDDLSSSPKREDERLLEIFEQLAEVRRAFADKVRFAPAPEQATVLLLLADFHETIFRAEGWQVCGRFAVDGAAVLFDAGLAPAYAVQLDQQSAAFLQAVVAAVETPMYHGEVHDDDWAAVTQELIAAGAQWPVINSVAGADPADPGLCPALSAFFRAIAVSESGEGERARADFAQNVIGY